MPTKAIRSFSARERHLCDGTRVFLFLVWLSRALILTDIGVPHEDTAGTFCRRPLLVSAKTGEPSRRPSPGCTLSSRGLIVVLGRQVSFDHLDGCQTRKPLREIADVVLLLLSRHIQGWLTGEVGGYKGL